MPHFIRIAAKIHRRIASMLLESITRNPRSTKITAKNHVNLKDEVSLYPQ